MAKDKLKEEDIYKIDLSFDDDIDEIDNIYKLDDICDDLDDDSEDVAKIEVPKKRKRPLKKIEEGIRSSKVETKIKDKDTKAVTAKATTTKETKTSKKSATSKTTDKETRATRTAKATKTTRTRSTRADATNVARRATADRQSEIRMHTENNLTEITLRQNRYKIEMQKNEYNIYTEDNDTSYIIVREPSLRLVAGGSYILIERQGTGKQQVTSNQQGEGSQQWASSQQGADSQEINSQVLNGQSEDYAITTNQDFKINYVIDNLERRNNVVNFKLTNLTQIEAIDDGLIFEIDEEKIIENNLEDNNTLVISEEDGKVYLPYTKDEIKNEVLQHKGTKIADVIEGKYIQPLDKYKNSMRARFREGYNLMYQREGKSKKSAILLGLELMFESNLHPAIISACKNLEELDIYLDCLEDNELEKFSCFKIIYKSLPTLRKKAKYQEI